jgi:DNA-binding XRE family transcriptional regulator
LQYPKYVMNHMDRFAGLTDYAAMAPSGLCNRFSARNSVVSTTVAANIRRLRKERGWTQDDLAAEANVRQAAIGLIETGRANPTLLMLETVINALDVGFVDLFTAPGQTRRVKDG